MRVRAEAELQSLGLRSRHLIALTVLRERGGSSTQQDLAAVLGIDRTNLVGLLNELEADQLVIRRRAPEDRRRHIVELTASGADKLDAAEAAIGAAEDEVLGALSDDQRDQLYELLHLANAGRAPGCGEQPVELDEDC